MSRSPNRKSLPLFASAMGLLGSAALLSAPPARAQSFDCQKAFYADEKTICRDSHLGQLDQELASAYGRWVAKLPKQERDEIDGNETLFVQARRRCGQNRKCIEQSYRNRIEEIQEAIGTRETGGRQPGVRDSARASDFDRRPNDTAEAKPPEHQGNSSEPAPGAVEKPASATPVPPVANPPTRAEAAEALRSARREESVETQASTGRRRAHAHTASPSPPQREAVLTKQEQAKPEPSAGESSAPAKQQPPAKHHAAKKGSAVAANAPVPKQQTAAPTQTKPSAGSAPSISWVNPPPER